MWGPSFCGTLACTSVSAFGTVKPEPAAGTCQGAPETDDITTVSPGATVMSGLSVASKKPQWTVSAPASKRCVVMRALRLLTVQSQCASI